MRKIFYDFLGFLKRNRKGAAVALSVAVFVLLATEGIMLYNYLKPSEINEVPVIGTDLDEAEAQDVNEDASAPPKTSNTDGDLEEPSPEASKSSDIPETPDIPEVSDDDTGLINVDWDDAPVSENPPVTDKPATSPVVTGTANITATFNAGNTWEDGGKTVVQFDGVVKNAGASACSNWTITMEVPNDTELIGSWNGVYSVSGGKLTVKNESYNGELSAGGTTEIGFQLKSSSKINLSSGSGSGSGGGNNSGNTTSSGGNGGNAAVMGTPPSAYKPSAISGKQGDDWLSVKGNKIVDKDGKEVWLTGINWFGYNTGTNTFDGLWACNLEQALQGIADRGFNLLRIPMSVELVKDWSNGIYPSANYNNASNSKLNDMNSLEIFEYVLEVCGSVGIKVMLDMHSAESDPMGHMEAVWFKGKISTEDFYASLEWLADRYKNNDAVIAYDLKNEPHGKPNESPRAIWNNSTSADNWKHIAQTAALKVLNKNPNVLIMVEGIEIYPINTKTNGDFKSTNSADYYYNWWGGNLRGVKDYPLDLGKYQNKLVYSPHDYGPAVYEQPWFKGGYTYDSLMKDCWKDNWFFIYENKTAPLLIGEWGGFMTEPNLTWMTHMRTLIKTYKLNHTFWCYNQNSGDTGGMVGGDFITWDEEKYAFVKDVLWQKGDKFVGLDHEVPLGSNGIALKNY